MWGSVTHKESSGSYYGIEPKVRYSDVERRKNIYEITGKREYRSIVSHCESVAMIINDNCLAPIEDGFFLNAGHLSEYLSRYYRAPIGEHESFRDEPVLGGGTAFLVDDRFMLTAGHCVCKRRDELSVGEDPETLDIEKIRNRVVVFGFQKNFPAQSEFRFQKKDVYKIKKVIAHRNTRQKDWALIKLDRPVEDRTPLRIDFFSKIYLNTNLYMIGHPTGLPLKLTEGARVKTIEQDYFSADIDGFNGNSGSPIFDKTKNVVIGILVRGPANDYCRTPNYRSTGLTRVQVRQVDGEREGYDQVQKINQIRFVQHYLLAKSGDLDAYYQVALDYNFGEGGVKVDFSKAVKWMQKASDRGHAQAAIDLRILPEFNASRVLKLGRIGLSQHKATEASNYAVGVLTSIVTLPLLTLPGVHLAVKLTNKLESRFFELLSLDDERFNLFRYISSGEIDKAEEELEKHIDFYGHIVRTHAFKGRLRTSKPEYVRFFQNKALIPSNFGLYQEYSIFDPLIELREKYCSTEL